MERDLRDGSGNSRELRTDADGHREGPPGDAGTQLARRARDGDPLAFAALYRHYFPGLERFFRSAGRRAEESQDLAQQTMLSVFQHLQSWNARPGVPFSAWLFRIAQNQLISYLRREARLEAHDPAELARWLDARQASRLRSNASNDDPAAANGARSEPELARWIARLSPAQREVLSLRYVLGLGHREIGVRMDRTPEAVRKLLSRTLSFLEQRLVSDHEQVRPPRLVPTLPPPPPTRTEPKAVHYYPPLNI